MNTLLFGTFTALMGVIWIGGMMKAASMGNDPLLKDWVLAHVVVLVGAVFIVSAIFAARSALL